MGNNTDLLWTSNPFGMENRFAAQFQLSSAYIDRLNGLMALSHGSRPVAADAVIQFTPDGHLHRSFFPEPVNLEVRGPSIGITTLTVVPDGKPVPPPAPAPSEVQRWSEIADQETLLNEALIYFGRATNDNWFDIYKALECLTKKYGGEHAFMKLNWVPAEAKWLKQTADSFRHAKRKVKEGVPEFIPMGSKGARELLGQLLRRALQEAAGGHSRPTP